MVEYDLGNGSNHDLNLQELLESLAPTVVSAKDKYFVLPACKENTLNPIHHIASLKNKYASILCL